MIELAVGQELVVGIALLWTVVMVRVRAGARVRSPI